MKKSFLVIAAFIIILVAILAGLTFLSNTNTGSETSNQTSTSACCYTLTGQCTKIVPYAIHETTDSVVVTKTETNYTTFNSTIVRSYRDSETVAVFGSESYNLTTITNESITISYGYVVCTADP